MNFQRCLGKSPATNSLIKTGEFDTKRTRYGAEDHPAPNANDSHIFQGADMVIALADIILFVTAFVSLTYGTRIAWQFGRICKLKNNGKQLSEKIMGYIPIAAFVYFIGFAIIAKYFYKFVYGRNFEELGLFYKIFIPLIISLLSSCAIAWVAMPKRWKISHDSHGAETLDDLAENP